MYLFSLTIFLLYICGNTLLDYKIYGAVQWLQIIQYTLFVLPEIFCFTYLSIWLIKNKHKITWSLFSFLIITIYLSQSLSIYKSGDMVSALSLSNLTSISVFVTTKLLCAIVFFYIIILSIIFYNLYQLRKSQLKPPKPFSKACFACALSLMLIQNITHDGFCFATPPYTPIVSFLISAKEAYVDPLFIGEVNSKIKYPFLRHTIYSSKLPFTDKYKVKSPNVIVFFMEGTSARELTGFDGHVLGLTPNISNFAKTAICVNNYYNHTAATFRGLHGQMCSAYPYNGGDMGVGKGWINGEAGKLAQTKYCSVADILADKGYDTIFFSPHIKSYPLNNLLHMLGFRRVNTAEDSLAILKHGQDDMLPEGSLSDELLFEIIVSQLKSMEHNRTKPFFIGVYNMGTHLNIDVTANGLKYANSENSILNTLHNYDNCFGKFYKYFKKSPYAKNTIVILTADHAHYPDPIYRQLTAYDKNYQPLFIDKIPLYILIPFKLTPHNYQNGITTSAQLAPTLLHLLDINNVRNAFMDTSIFDKASKKDFGINFMGNFHLLADKIYEEQNIPPKYKKEYSNARIKITLFQSCEKNNRVFHR